MNGFPPVLAVSQAIELCNSLFSELELYVEGEVASYTVSRGKFVFFDLKDETAEARLSCFMMLHQQSIPLEDGMRIVVRARPTIFAKSGKFSLAVQQLEAKGEGSIKRAFELLRAKLESEGLFASERKRALPRFAERVGIISSADAAGYGDFIRICGERLPGVSFILANVPVQGKDAERAICQAFDHLNSHHQLDVIVLVRGGGSIEDLHAFNSELVARAIIRSKVPVLVGVGHERDVTIADFCADVRAATPSNAAQILLPPVQEVRDLVFRLTQDGRFIVEQAIQEERNQVESILRHVRTHLGFTIESTRQRITALNGKINAISPAQTLARGYSIVRDERGKVVVSASSIKAGAMLHTQLRDGEITSIAQ